MDFKTFVHIVYIKGYCFFNKSNITQYEFTKTLLEKSVKDSSKLDIDESTLNGYIGGNPYHTLSRKMIDAGMNKTLIKSFFEEQFDTKHKNTKTYKKRFHGQAYKNALHEKAHKSFSNLTLDNMSDVLAACFCKVFYDDLAIVQTTSQSTTAEKRSAIIERDYIDEKEKSVIIDHCKDVLQALKDIKHKTDRIDKLQGEIKNASDASIPQPLKAHLQYELDYLTSNLEKRYAELENLCSELIILQDQKEHKPNSMAKLSEIAHKLIEESNRFKITSSEGFRYSALSMALLDFKECFNKLKQDWNTV